MTTVNDVMTRDVQVVEPGDTLQHAASLMDELNVGSLPVCSGRRLRGMITDRDITVRAAAVGLSPLDTRVEEVMTEPSHYCTAEQSLAAVMRHMGDLQIRRLPVLDENENIVGIVALGDLATHQSNGVETALRRISTPSEPDRPPA